MPESCLCSFCDYVGITPVSNDLATVTYPSIKKKNKVPYLDKSEFGRVRQVISNLR